jgi:thiamine biosynthesis protein ThiI
LNPLSGNPDAVWDRWKGIPWTGALFHYDEIALKGGFRGRFARTLEANLRNALREVGVEVHRAGDRVMARGPGKAAWTAAERGARVRGVAYSAAIAEVSPDIGSLEAQAVAIYREVSRPGDSFAVRVRRADESFPLRTNELVRLIGQAVADATGAPVNLGRPAVTLEFRIYADGPVLVGPHLEGPGGLPVGVHPAVLVLFSGDLDSPVAAYLMMRRGAPVDFLHFHTYRSAEAVRDSKIVELVRKLIEPEGPAARLILVPDYRFTLAVWKAEIGSRWHLALLRRFMVRVANAFCDIHGNAAVVTGDSLGQVASQTMENLAAADAVGGRPILRPLIGWNKREIVAMSRRLGYYDLSVLPYKDCCSLVARRAALRPDLRRLSSAEERVNISEVVRESVRESVCWIVGRNGILWSD